jgi:transketolase
MDQAYALKRPVYLRMGKADRGDVHSGPVAAAEMADPIPVKPGTPGGPAILATGAMLTTAMRLAEQDDALSVWSVPSIKPLDPSAITAIAGSCSGLVVLEEHSVHGGLGAAIAEIVSESAPCRVLRIGIRDRFSQYCGSYEYLLREHGLDLESVKERVDAFRSTL